MNQLSIEQAFELLILAEQDRTGLYNDLRSARESGYECYNAGLGLEACPYSADKSARRRAVWIASWMNQRGYRSGLDRTHRPLTTLQNPVAPLGH